MDIYNRWDISAFMRPLLVLTFLAMLDGGLRNAKAESQIQVTSLKELRISNEEILPLPPGNWRVVFKTALNLCRFGNNCGGKAFILNSIDKKSVIRTIVVRQTSNRVRNWNTRGCYADGAKKYAQYFDAHETRENQLLNKCSRGYPNNTDYPVVRSDWRWDPLKEGFADLPRLSVWNVHFEIVLFEQNKRYYEIDIFVDRGDLSSYATDEVLKAWKKVYVEGLASGLFRGATYTDPIIFAVNTGDITISDTAPIADVGAASSTNNEHSEARRDNREAEERLGKEYADREKIEEERLREEELAKAIELEEKVRLADARAEYEKIEAARLREKELAREVTRQEAARLARERDERERVAKLEQERQRRLEAARKAESVEEQLRRLQDTLAMLKEQAAQPLSQSPKLIKTPRHALVIGNAGYQSVGALNNATSDAVSFARALEKFGFTVALYTDIKAQEFKTAVFEFTQQVEIGAEVIFYYAGHGVQFGSSNYLLPTDVGADNSEDVKVTSLELQQILNSISQKQVKFSLAVIDACRDNPFKVAAAQPKGRGLANNPKMQAVINASGVSPSNNAAIGQMVIYSASAGQQALDNPGPNDPNPNGLFTRVFLEKMKQSGLAVDRILRLVKNDVIRLAKSVNHDQVPALYDQTVGEFYFTQE